VVNSQNTNQVYRAVVFALAGAAFGLAPMAHAADTADDAAAASATAEEPANSGLEDVVVTARRVQERLQDVPIAITALSGAELESKGITSLYNLQTYVPSLRVTTFNNPDTLVVGIRGQRNSQVQPGQDPSIGVYFSDVPTGFQVGLNTGMFDLSDIQVLKGPQGTLFGRNSTGGAVLINPAKPTNTFEGYVKAGFVDVDKGTGETGQAVVNVPLSDTLALRAGIDVVNQDGYVKNWSAPYLVPEVFPSPRGLTNGKALGDIESQTWRLGLLWKPTDGVDNYMVYQGVHYRSDNGLNPTLVAVNPKFPLAKTIPTITQWLPQFLAATQAAQSTDFWTTGSGSQSFVNVDTELLYDTLTWDLGSVTVKNIAGWKWLKSERFQDSVGIPYELVMSLYDPQKGRDLSEEFQLQGHAFNDSFKWVGGLFYFNNNYASGTDPSIQLATPGLAIPLNFVTPDVRTAYTYNKTQAIFAQGTYELPWVKGLSLTGGGRYTRDERQMLLTNHVGTTSCLLTNATGAKLPLANCTYYGSKQFSQPTYLVSLDYKLDPQTLVYVSTSRGYRAGGFNIGATSPTAFAPYNPETVKNYELGLKKDWLFDPIALRTNAAIYYQDYSNIQRIAQDTSAGNVTATRLFNATQANIKGAEFELTAQLMKGLELGLSYAYVLPEYSKAFFTPAPDGTQQNIALNAFSLVSKNTFTANIAYTLPTPASVGDFVVSADYSYQSRYYYDDVAQGPLYGPLDAQSAPGYGLANARLDWNHVMGSTFDVDFRVTNLTNKEYYNYGVPIWPSIGAWSNFVGQPRFMYLEAKYSFGK
jgi:iron complex outermembrane recepter protein